MCPWAWITSRWVSEVQQLRDYDVRWRFISLKMINEDLVADWYTPEYKAGHMAGLYAHRVCDEVRLRHHNDAVGALYTALGTAFHTNQRRPEINADPAAFMTEMLRSVGLPAGYATHVDDESHDLHIRSETDLAFERTGKGVGTPILTFRPGGEDEASFFGPVIASIPRGHAALKLWDAVETIATSSGMAELKRSNRATPVFD